MGGGRVSASVPSYKAGPVALRNLRTLAGPVALCKRYITKASTHPHFKNIKTRNPCPTYTLRDNLHIRPSPKDSEARQPDHRAEE